MPLDMHEATDEMHRLSKLLDDGLAALRRLATEYADAEMAYREAKARAWVSTPRSYQDGKVMYGKEREAIVDSATAKERRVRDIADSMRQAALESVRSRRAQVSALQSLLAAERAEIGMARFGPD